MCRKWREIELTSRHGASVNVNANESLGVNVRVAAEGRLCGRAMMQARQRA